MLDKLKQQYEENPLATILVVAFAAKAAGRLVDSLSKAQMRRSWGTRLNP